MSELKTTLIAVYFIGLGTSVICAMVYEDARFVWLAPVWPLVYGKLAYIMLRNI